MESYCKPPKNLSFHGDLSENWRKFKQNFDIFITASESEEKKSEVKVALLLNFMGEDGVEVYNSFNLDGTEKDDIEKVVQAFQNYCAPKKNIVSESVKFLKRYQADGETFDSFLTSLEQLSETCEYGNMKERMIRDQLVAGIRDKALHERLLKTSDLDLQKALEICRAAEASEAKATASDVKVVVVDDVCGSREKKCKKQNSECNIECQAEEASGGEIGSTERETTEARSEATFRYTVKSFSRMKGRQLSPPCYVSDLPWKIMVEPRNDQTPGQKYLGFYLQCNGESKSASWSCHASAELRLLSNKEGTEPFTRKIDKLFSSKENDWGYPQFMTWQDVLKVENGYVKNHSITLEVHLVAGVAHGVEKGGDRAQSEVQ